MAATAAGVLTSTPEPPRAARAQMLPPCRLSWVVPAVPPATSLTVRVELRPTRIWVWSANRIARLPIALVRSVSPPSTLCWMRAERQQILAHEAHFLAALGGHDGAGGRRRARHGGLRLRIGKAKREGAGRGQKPEKS